MPIRSSDVSWLDLEAVRSLAVGPSVPSTARQAVYSATWRPRTCARNDPRFRKNWRCRRRRRRPPSQARHSAVGLRLGPSRDPLVRVGRRDQEWRADGRLERHSSVPESPQRNARPAATTRAWASWRAGWGRARVETSYGSLRPGKRIGNLLESRRQAEPGRLPLTNGSHQLSTKLSVRSPRASGRRWPCAKRGSAEAESGLCDQVCAAPQEAHTREPPSRMTCGPLAAGDPRRSPGRTYAARHLSAAVRVDDDPRDRSDSGLATRTDARAQTSIVAAARRASAETLANRRSRSAPRGRRSVLRSARRCR
jgi:hypothetical protein